MLLRVTRWSTCTLTLIMLLSTGLSAFYCSLPADVVLTDFTNKANTLQHISDIVDAPLLDIENLDCIIQVDCLLWSCLEKINEFFSELNQTVFFPASSALVILEETLRVHPTRIVNAFTLCIGSSCQSTISLAVVASVVSIVRIITMAPLGGLYLNGLSLMRACLLWYLRCKSW